jgi:hypothetical protein
LKVRVAELRPMFVPPDRVKRTDYRPGELAQWDLWFPPVEIPSASISIAAAGHRGGEQPGYDETHGGRCKHGWDCRPSV